MIFLLPTKSQVIHMPGLLGVVNEVCHQGGWWVGGYHASPGGTGLKWSVYNRPNAGISISSISSTVTEQE